MNLSICILSWKGGDVLKKTLETYKSNGLLDLSDDIKILFQEFNQKDYSIACEYGVDIIAKSENIGIGKGFRKLVENARYENVLLLEHDWNLVENSEVTFEQLSKGISFLDNGYDVVRYRHRKNFGEPLFSKEYMGKELTEYDKLSNETGTHLLESLYWCDPSILFPDKITKEENWFTTTSRWANFTNNPSLYKKDFYLKCIEGYEGVDIQLEYNISHWWCRQNFKIAQGDGLFKHNDFIKYGFTGLNNDLI